MGFDEVVQFRAEELRRKKGKMPIGSSSSSDSTSNRLSITRRLHVIFIGPMAAGKSTIVGQILHLTGQVDETLLERYRQEAIQNGEENAYMSYITNTKERENRSGLDPEVGIAAMDTPTTYYTLLDAPSDRRSIPRVAWWSRVADIAVLVVSAPFNGTEEFEQTREYIQIAKYCGISKLLVVVNKMEDIHWSIQRFHYIANLVLSMSTGDRLFEAQDITFLPVSGHLGHNVATSVDRNICPWSGDHYLFQALDRIEVSVGDPHGPLRIFKLQIYEADKGAVVWLGKVEWGRVWQSDLLLIMPERIEVRVERIDIDDRRVTRAGPGEEIMLKLSKIRRDKIPLLDIISVGSVLCDKDYPIPVATEFNAIVTIRQTPDQGMLTDCQFVMLINGIEAECTIIEVHGKVAELATDIHRQPYNINKEWEKSREGAECIEREEWESSIEGKEWSTHWYEQMIYMERLGMGSEQPFAKKGAIIGCRIRVNHPTRICVEYEGGIPRFGKFILRSFDGLMVATGEVGTARALAEGEWDDWMWQSVAPPALLEKRLQKRLSGEGHLGCVYCETWGFLLDPSENE